MRYSKLLLITLVLVTACSRRVIEVETETQDGTTDCLSPSAALRAVQGISGGQVQKGTEVLWEVEASGCKGFRLTRTDDTLIKSFATKIHFTKRYTTVANTFKETVLVQPVYKDGSLGDEFTVQSVAFNVLDGGDTGDDDSDDDSDGEDDTNAAFSCHANADYSAITARKDHLGAWIGGAPWMTFSIITNKPSKLIAANDPADNTVFPSGIPSSSAQVHHRIAGQLQKENLNPVHFKVALASDESKTLDCLAPVNVTVVQEAAPAPPSCEAYAVPGSLFVQLGSDGKPVGSPTTNFHINASRLAKLTKVITSQGEKPVTGPNAWVHIKPEPVFAAGWNEFTFEIADANNAALKGQCSAKVWVQGTISPQAPTCTLAGPDEVAPGATPMLTLTASGGAYTQASIDGVGQVLPGSGKAIVFPSATTTYVGRIKGYGGETVCTKTVKVVNLPGCQLIASAPAVAAGQEVTLTLVGQGNFTAAEIATQSSTIPLQLSDLTKKVYPEATTTYTGRLTGSSGTATCTATVRVDPIVVGIHFEDSKDWDLNDAVVCVKGMFKLPGNEVVSTATQTVRAKVTTRAACSNKVQVKVVDNYGSQRQFYEFKATSAPNMDLYFESGWKLDVKFKGGGSCDNVGWTGYGNSRVQIDNFCRNGGC